ARSVDPIVLDAPRDVDAMAPDPVLDTDPISLDTLADVPVLTDAVVAWPPLAASRENAEIAGEAIDAGIAGTVTVETDAGDAFPASAGEAEAVAASARPPAVLEQEASEPAHEEAPAAAPAAPAAPRSDDDFILDIPPAQQEAPAALDDDSPIPLVAGPATLMPGGRDWDALAEEIRMQVLQRLDLFTDTALREQLGARLSPIVEHASAALVETINRELG